MVIIGVTLFFELFFLALYKKTQFKYEKIRGTGRVHDIAYVQNWNQFYKVILICIPIAVFLICKGLIT